MKTFGKFLSIFCACILLGCCCMGCGPGVEYTPDNWDVEDEGESVTLNFTHIWPEHAETFDKIIKNFENKYTNVKINTTVKNYNNIGTAISTSWGTPQFPDVCFMWVHSPGGIVNPEVQMAADLTDIYYNAHKTEFLGDGDCFIAGKTNEKYYIVPFRATGFVIYYNKTIFDNLGLTAPKNLEEFEVLLKDIQVKSNGEITPLNVWGATGTFSYINSALSAYYDQISGKAQDPYYRTGRLENAPGELQDKARIVEKVRDWRNKRYFGSNPLAGSNEGSTEAFLNAKCAMAMLNNNDLPTIMSDMTDEVGVFSLPGFSSMDDPQAGYVSGGYDGFFISNISKNKAWALRFLEHLNSKESQQLFADNEGSVMSRKDITYPEGLHSDVAHCMRNVGVLGTFPDYSLSSAAKETSTSVGTYMASPNGDLATALSKLQASYNDLVTSVTDPFVNKGNLTMIKPTWTKNESATQAFMQWIGEWA